MANQVLVNTAKWDIKKKAVIAALYPTSVKLVAEASDLVLKETKRNVQGSPTAAPQSEPVPRRSFQLFRSIKRSIVNPIQHKVYSDSDVAPHNKYVHWGTRKMRPRRFLQDVLTQWSRFIYTRMDKGLTEAIQKIGRS